MTVQPPPDAPLRILAISGSLRAVSSNTALLRAAVLLAGETVAVTLYDGLADLPAFNPDDDGETPPRAVRDWRERLDAADGILISSPEYAHGVPGALKNALDWVVGSGELVGKPVALWNPSPRGTYAQASLTETLGVMMAVVVEEAGVTLPIAGGVPRDAAALAADAATAATLRAALAAFAAVIRRGTAQGDATL